MPLGDPSPRLGPLETRRRRIGGDSTTEGAMTSRILRSAAITAMLIIGVVGCGGSVADQSEPAGAVRAAMDAAQSGGIVKLAEYACAARKSDIATLFGGESVGSLTALGIDPNEIFGAIKFEFKDVK